MERARSAGIEREQADEPRRSRAGPSTHFGIPIHAEGHILFAPAKDT